MQYEQAARLGALIYETLGISPNARVSMSMTRQGAVIQDLETRTRYEVPDGDQTKVRRATFEVPHYVKNIIALSDAALVEQFRQSLGNPNLQIMAALRSECGFRGIDPLE